MGIWNTSENKINGNSFHHSTYISLGERPSKNIYKSYNMFEADKSYGKMRKYSKGVMSTGDNCSFQFTLDGQKRVY